MALPELVRMSVEKKLSAYCLKRAPVHVFDRFKVGFRFRGNNVTLFESRPYFDDPNQWTENVVAQFRFDPGTAFWTLYYPDRNSRWLCYNDFAPSRKIEKLLQEVDNDPTGIFWG